MSTKRWDSPAYQRIASVQSSEGTLAVLFEDGTEVGLKAEQLLPPGAHSPDWNALHADSYEIIVPTASGEIEIPWSTIRLLTDQEFGAHWARAAEDQARTIGRQLRELRKMRDLTSKEVAERAGITPQSLSRIERGHHDVVFTTLRKILAAMGCTLKDLAEVSVAPASMRALLKRLESVGVRKEWVLNRLLPEDLLSRFDTAGPDTIQILLHEASGYISRVFGWSPDDVLRVAPLSIDGAIAQAARFKARGRIQEIQATAYAVYAHYLALLALQASEHIRPRQPPDSFVEIRKEIADRYGFLSLDSLLRYTWDLGIPVLPLQDSGSFHGACWRVRDRSVIVLKQVTPYHARWQFDLAHELKHVAGHLSEDRTDLIEPAEISPFEDYTDEELEASSFASDLLLSGRAEELAERNVESARNKVELLKSAVLRVAASEHVPVDVLANYLAYRLTLQGINWWGAANNLQITEPSPPELAWQIFFEYANLESLNPEDREMLLRAVSR